MERSEDKLCLTEKMLLVYGKVKSIHKTGKIDIDKSKDKSYKVVTHDEVTRVLHDAFTDVGIVCLPSQKSCIISEYKIASVWNDKESIKTGYKAEVTIEYTFINANDPKDTLTSTATAFAMDPSDKAIGKAYSMAVKMILLKTFMLESTDEEEARSAEDGTSYNEIKSTPKPPIRVPVTKRIAISSPSNYVITFSKHKGSTISEMHNKGELVGFVNWLRSQHDLKKDALEFLENADAFLSTQEEIPF